MEGSLGGTGETELVVDRISVDSCFIWIAIVDWELLVNSAG